MFLGFSKFFNFSGDCLRFLFKILNLGVLTYVKNPAKTFGFGQKLVLFKIFFIYFTGFCIHKTPAGPFGTSKFNKYFFIFWGYIFVTVNILSKSDKRLRWNKIKTPKNPGPKSYGFWDYFEGCVFKITCSTSYFKKHNPRISLNSGVVFGWGSFGLKPPQKNLSAAACFGAADAGFCSFKSCSNPASAASRRPGKFSSAFKAEKAYFPTGCSKSTGFRWRVSAGKAGRSPAPPPSGMKETPASADMAGLRPTPPSGWRRHRPRPV